MCLDVAPLQRWKLQNMYVRGIMWLWKSFMVCRWRSGNEEKGKNIYIHIYVCIGYTWVIYFVFFLKVSHYAIRWEITLGKLCMNLHVIQVCKFRDYIEIIHMFFFCCLYITLYTWITCGCTHNLSNVIFRLIA